MSFDSKNYGAVYVLSYEDLQGHNHKYKGSIADKEVPNEKSQLVSAKSDIPNFVQGISFDEMRRMLEKTAICAVLQTRSDIRIFATKNNGNPELFIWDRTTGHCEHLPVKSFKLTETMRLCETVLLQESNVH